MKKLKVSKVILILAILGMICCVSTVNYATGDVNGLIQNITQLPSDENPSPTSTSTPTPTQTPTQSISPIGGTTNTAGNKTTTNTALPKTGTDDVIMWVLIGVSAVAAIYTYKKVRDYNV